MRVHIYTHTYTHKESESLGHALMSEGETKENRGESNTGENYIHEAGMIEKGLEATEDEEKDCEGQTSAEKNSI